jgi:hypothetical protein
MKDDTGRGLQMLAISTIPEALAELIDSRREEVA